MGRHMTREQGGIYHWDKFMEDCIFTAPVMLPYDDVAAAHVYPPLCCYSTANLAAVWLPGFTQRVIAHPSFLTRLIPPAVVQHCEG